MKGYEGNPVSFNFNKTLIIQALLLLVAWSGLAQVSQPHRYERKQKGSEEYPTIVPLKEEGLFVVQNKEKYEGGKRLWEIVVLDTALQQKKKIDLSIESRNNLVGYEYTPGFVYLLYRTADTNKNIMELFEFTTAGDQIGHYEIKPELDFKLTHFIKVGDKIIFGGYVSKEPVILIYEPATNLIKVVPGFFQKDNELLDLRSNQNKTFNVVLIDRSLKVEKKLIFKTFDENGGLLLEDVIPMDEKKTLQTSISTALEHEELMVMGTWGDRQSKQSEGFFVLNIDPFNDQKIHYYYFPQLSHYLDRLKPSRAKHIKDKADKDITAGRSPGFTDYVMPFKIEENKEGFLMLAEVYNPVSSGNQFSGPYGYGTVYGSPYYYNSYWPNYYSPGRMYNPYYSNNSKPNTEITTVQTILLAVDHNGSILWDQSMKLDEVNNHNALEQVSDFYCSATHVTMLCKKKEGELQIRTVEIADDEGKDLTEKIKLNDPLDEYRAEREDKGGLSKWYDNSFYVWGYQTIRNINHEDRLREVFYINKVVVRK